MKAPALIALAVVSSPCLVLAQVPGLPPVFHPPKGTLPVTSDLGPTLQSSQPSISADGRLVAYETASPSAPGDTCVDIHVRDLLTGTVQAITTCDSNSSGSVWPSYHPVLSGDGTRVAYERLAGSPPIGSVLVSDVTGAMPPEIASVNDLGVRADSVSLYPTISFDGEQVAFFSTATNLVSPPLGFNNVYNVYVRDRTAGKTLLVSATLGGAPTQDGHCQYPAISADGRFVVFESVATDLVAAGLDNNGTQDVYLRDRDPDGNGVLDEGNALTRLVSRDAAGFAALNGGQKPAISADGRFIAFLSFSSDLAGVSGNQFQVHVCDLDPDADGDYSNSAATFEVVSCSNGGAIGNSHSYHPSISADGRLVAFSTWSSNLVPNDSAHADGFVYDRQTDQIRRISVDSYGTAGDDHSLGGWYSDDPALSADGTRVAFSSEATNLVTGDTNGLEDVFAHDYCLPVGVDLGYALAGSGGLQPVLSASGDLGSGGSATLRLREALPGALVFVASGSSSAPAAYLGGTLVPSPAGLFATWTTDALGGAQQTLAGGGGPYDLYVQALIVDPGAPGGMAFSNALRLEFQP